MEMRMLGPRGLFGMARSTVGWAVDSAVAVATVPGRVLSLLAAAEALVDRVDHVVTVADEMVRRTDRVLDETESLVGRAGSITSAADRVVGDASRVSDNVTGVVTTAGHTARAAQELLAVYEPLARQALPMAKRFVEELSPHEIEAAIRLVDELPVLTEHLISDILPILATLDRVGPDIHQLLDVANDVRQAILGIPGFNFLRRRGEDKAPDPATGNGEPGAAK